MIEAMTTGSGIKIDQEQEHSRDAFCVVTVYKNTKYTVLFSISLLKTTFFSRFRGFHTLVFESRKECHHFFREISVAVSTGLKY